MSWAQLKRVVSCCLLLVGGERGGRERGTMEDRPARGGRPGPISEASHIVITPPRLQSCKPPIHQYNASHFSADRQVGQTCWVPSPRVEYCCSSPVQRPSARQPALSQPSVWAVLRRSAHRYHSIIITRDGECRHRSPPAGAAPLPSRPQP